MHDIYRVCFDEDFVGVVLLAMTEKYKTIIKWHGGKDGVRSTDCGVRTAESVSVKVFL